MENPELPIYDELPNGLIDVPSAARRHDLNLRTIHSWIRVGHISRVGRLRAPARGGGYSVVNEAELVAYKNAPRNKGGRPRKSWQRMS